MLEDVLARTARLARVEANRALLRFVNGIVWLTGDPSSAVGRTPYDVIFRDGKMQVRRYRSPDASRQRRHPLPLLMIPPLIVKPFIFDLYPGRSLVEFLLKHRFRVYLVDFGEPDDADALVKLDDYVLKWVPAACTAVKKDARAAELSLLGYCMGAAFALSHVAANEDRTVRNIVDIAAPVDVEALGALAWLVKVAAVQAEVVVARIGNVPGGLSSTVFQLLAPAKRATRYVDLVVNLWNREYVRGFDAMNQWVGQLIDYPQQAFLQFSREFVRKNKFVKGRMRFGDKVADLKRVESSLLVFAGRNDRLAPVRSVRAVLAAVGSRDKEFHVVPGGHMAVFAGRGAPENVWTRVVEWLAPRSQRRPAQAGSAAGSGARSAGSDTGPPPRKPRFYVESNR